MTLTLIITLIVVTVPGLVAWLCWTAVRVWRGNWRKLAAAPLAILFLLLVSLGWSWFSPGGLRQLWPFEVFLWAMATVVYLVVLMTAKKTFDKADSNTLGDQ